MEQALSVSDSPVDESVPAVTSILTRENIFITAVLICSLATTILVVVPDWHNKPLVIAGFESSIWLSLILQFAVTLFVVSYQIFVPLLLVRSCYCLTQQKGISHCSDGSRKECWQCSCTLGCFGGNNRWVAFALFFFLPSLHLTPI